MVAETTDMPTQQNYEKTWRDTIVGLEGQVSELTDAIANEEAITKALTKALNDQNDKVEEQRGKIAGLKAAVTYEDIRNGDLETTISELKAELARRPAATVRP